MKDILLGAEVAYDTAKADLTKYNFVAGEERGIARGVSLINVQTPQTLTTRYSLFSLSSLHPAGYHAADFQASATLADKLSVLKLVYSHNVSAKATVGAELSRSLAGGATTFALAYARM